MHIEHYLGERAKKHFLTLKANFFVIQSVLKFFYNKIISSEHNISRVEEEMEKFHGKKREEETKNLSTTTCASEYGRKNKTSKL